LHLERFRRVGEIYTSEGYDWSAIGVFQDVVDGTFRFASDGGCSCNYPWESFTHLDHYGPRLDAREVSTKVMAETSYYDDDPVAFKSDCLELVRLIHEAAKK